MGMYTLRSLISHRAASQQSLRAASRYCPPWVGADIAEHVRLHRLGPKHQIRARRYQNPATVAAAAVPQLAVTCATSESCGGKYQNTKAAAPHWAVACTAVPGGRIRCGGSPTQRRPYQTFRNAEIRSVSRYPETSIALPAYEPTAAQRKQLDEFVAFLLEESQKYNLTGAKTVEELNSRHVDDCLSLLPVLDMAAAAAEQSHAQDTSNGLLSGSPADDGVKGKPTIRFLDIGSGAGLPGLLMAICRPHWQVVMLDSLRKRTSFLEAAVERLQLTNATALWARAEDAGNDPHHRESYDVVTARAVADMRVLAELTIPFLRVGGQLAVAKGALPQEEIASAAHAIKELGGADAVIIPVASHGPKGQRTAVCITKVARTGSRYPRPPKQISRGPL